ncbi:GAF domain-containing SpoIIE family protein phosphatase [Amycolatopsis sp., V23-08]|uniref:GAF domain-containing SpoIIE family protein phosphatase n=1 Tax=Amycolatopsis heterodermiae TaxID=3110235 RepID=A0ABU5R5N1_9PSEU|nr:GAF domain-containing SpoIIE family protein phosphatase [Amycolatopsis sp., V23-08]MEA5360969.1 GAF domain-containing SpoIIE family protein phosphatase [Amycolatopsis sp., V23-08]
MPEDQRPRGDEEIRLAALRDTGLSAVPDPGMERFARLTAGVLGVPLALVSLVESDRQVLPGLAGPWAGTRSAPLTHALSRHVVLSREPLILTDTRDDERRRADTAAGVASYAGMPLTDTDGHVLGSLDAIDTRPRAWTGTELSYLADLAAACSAELRLRIVSRRSSQAHQRADQLAAQARTALSRSELLLRAAEDLGGTSGLAEVRRQVRDLVTSDLKPSYVGLVLVEGRRLRRLVDVDHEAAAAMENTYEHYGVDDDWPTARAARDNTTIVIQGAGDLVAGGYTDDAVAAWHDLGLHTAICVPLPGTHIPLGTLVIGWDTDHDLGVVERAVVTALAGYAARAVERAQFLEDRISAAHRLQQAMLTELPEITGLDTAALYRPAAEQDLVGGDWYDAYLLPGAGDGGEDSAAPATVAISIGDITGHNLEAATLMGQWRSMLRQADLDHPGAGPARVVSALEHANRALGINASGTLIHAHLRPAEEGSWQLTWTTAGHPLPLLCQPDGTVEELEAGDVMLFPRTAFQDRTEQRIILRPGALLLCYTDGLVDQRGRDVNAGITRTGELLSAFRRRPLPAVLDTIADKVGGSNPEDDIALLVIRVPAAPSL